MVHIDRTSVRLMTWSDEPVDSLTEMPCTWNPDLWHADGNARAEQAIAVAWCHRCPVVDECAELGKNEPYGTWGGITQQKRNVSPPPWHEDLDREEYAAKVAESSYAKVARDLGVPATSLRRWVLNLDSYGVSRDSVRAA